MWPIRDGWIVTNITTTVDNWTVWDFPEPTEELDNRHNPKFWALWFREFLEELLGAGQAVLQEARQRHPLLLRIEEKCRSAPLLQREWVLKSWKQAH